MRPRWMEITFRTKREATPARIVGDAAVATVTLGEGRLIPLVIVDTSDRPDIDELVRVHEHIAPGDVGCQWGQLGGNPDKISLILEFQRPVELSVILEFDIEQDGGLVDLILTTRGLYLQPGRDGDRFITTMDHPRILVEIGDTGFRSNWDRMQLKSVVRRFRREGLSRQQAKQAARQFLEKWREFRNLRVRG